jgi:putative transposase
MRTAFRCRAYPTDEQAASLARTFGCVRKVWNVVLDWRIRRYRVDGACTSYAESDRYLTWLKKRPDLAFLCRADISLQGNPLQRSATKQEPQPVRAGIPVPQDRE